MLRSRIATRSDDHSLAGRHRAADMSFIDAEPVDASVPLAGAPKTPWVACSTVVRSRQRYCAPATASLS
jgi:hypothetical protein